MEHLKRKIPNVKDFIIATTAKTRFESGFKTHVGGRPYIQSKGLKWTPPWHLSKGKASKRETKIIL